MVNVKAFGALFIIILCLECWAVQISVEEVEKAMTNYYSSHPTKCPKNWADSYIKLHSEIKDNPQAKYLVAVPNLSGMADRIIGVVTTCMMAMLTHRVFQIGHRSPLIPLHTVFDSPHINWQRPFDPDWIIEPLKFKAPSTQYNASILADKQYYAINSLDNYKLLDSYLRQKLDKLLGDDAKTTFIVINRGLSIRMFENTHHKEQLRALQLTPETAFGCIVHLLFKPKPEIFLTTPTLFQSVMQVKESSKKTLLIGIQIRAGDQIFSHDITEVAHFNAYFDCARQIEEFTLKAGYEEVKWLVVTDSRSLRHKVVKLYGEKVITSLQTHIEHSAKESSVCQANCTVSPVGFQAAAAEWWMLSFADYHVISEYSGFGRTAAMLSFQTNHIYTVPYKKSSQSIQCSSTSASDMYDMPFVWSGI